MYWEIARRTGQSQSEVFDIASGRRRVENVPLLRRIVGGLEIPPEAMGLSWWGSDGSYWGPADAYSGQDTVTDHPEKVDDEVLRRHLLALGAVASFGVQIPGRTRWPIRTRPRAGCCCRHSCGCPT
ncbi:MAG TPA: hypothetical protein VJT72_06370 [Pseudonocardiaceae bacterium]|nr:hypothetical protein [Pseudonocardiaceae bacterium]